MMEKKKLLLVAVSVGVFLVVVIGASILVFAPRKSSPAAAANIVTPIPAGNPGQTGTSLPVLPDAVELVKNSLNPQGSKTAPDGSAQDDNIVYVYGENPATGAGTGRIGVGNRVTVDVARPTAAAVPDEPVRVAARPAAPPPKAAAPKAPAPKAAAPKTAAPGQPRKADNFWVQTGSFSTQARAEAAKTMLASKGITSLIENRDIDGKLFFRVRVGPYTSQNEADFWRELIKDIPGFEESQVWRSPAH